MKSFKVGPYTNDENNFGPLISKEHKKSVIDHIDSAENDGADIVVDGRTFKIENEEYRNGYYLGATLINNVKHDFPARISNIFILLVHLWSGVS